MEKLTAKQFNKIWLQESTNVEIGDIGDQLIPYIGGKAIRVHQEYLGSHTIELAIIYNPTHIITNQQLTDIFDEGNHCLSKGSIIYEGEYAYITWSNLGHI